MSIEDLNYQIFGCRKCRLWQGAKHAVPGEGPADAKIMIVGQNPGAEEDEVGRPFIGRSGRFLMKALAEQGITREQTFITNIVKHISPKNRKPFPDEIAACTQYLNAQIKIIKPNVIVLLGQAAKETPRLGGIEYWEIIHPSAAMRFTKMREKFRRQIAELADSINKVQQS